MRTFYGLDVMKSSDTDASRKTDLKREKGEINAQDKSVFVESIEKIKFEPNTLFPILGLQMT